jgi:membrane associated rhomboid family serine protease
MLGIWFGLQVVNALGTLGMSTQVNVAFFAHVGGFIAGVALMAVYKSVTGQRIWPSRFSYGSGVKYWRGRPLD